MDNDTVAAIVGAVVGALRGREAFPQEWIDGLLGRTGARDDGRVFKLITETRRFLGDEEAGGSQSSPAAQEVFGFLRPR